MKRLLALIAFSVLLLVPVAAQNALAGQPNQCVGMVDGAPCDNGDGNVCNSSCQAGQCSATTNADSGSSCEDGDQCTGPDTCDGAGLCQAGLPLQIPMCSVVGGSLTPIDTTMVLAAGAQSTSAWMIPVIVAGIGFAIVIARKF